jgi:hypothetical protein
MTIPIGGQNGKNLIVLTKALLGELSVDNCIRGNTGSMAIKRPPRQQGGGPGWVQRGASAGHLSAIDELPFDFRFGSKAV